MPLLPPAYVVRGKALFSQVSVHICRGSGYTPPLSIQVRSQDGGVGVPPFQPSQIPGWGGGQGYLPLPLPPARSDPRMGGGGWGGKEQGGVMVPPARSEPRAGGRYPLHPQPTLPPPGIRPGWKGVPPILGSDLDGGYPPPPPPQPGQIPEQGGQRIPTPQPGQTPGRGVGVPPFRPSQIPGWGYLPCPSPQPGQIPGWGVGVGRRRVG